MHKPVVYLSGPDRLAKDAAQRRADAYALVEKYGFEAAVLPDDLCVKSDADTAKALSAARMKAIDGCDLIIADTHDFRDSVEPFGGSGFELGYAYGKGKKLYCYMPDTREQGDRYTGPTTTNEKGRKVDMDGFGFEGTLNLMLIAPSTTVEGSLEDALKVAAADFFGEEK